MTHIVSALPGRIRIRGKPLRNTERLAALAAALGRLDAVHSVTPNPKAGSVVLLYDASAVEVDELEAEVEALTDAEVARHYASGPRSARMRINRYAKAGMLGSLAASLALAATGNKRWHAATGALFVAGLLVHLTVHRRRLLH
ncbi:heavy-metal-associated domain-containing protein [Thauera aromatica]|uniref:heavy-metal-associated domain-containing protein n=1 Tax=Thauera aromatica TaxID=59405 RepID=UPI001FFD7CA9|nr:heavy-metal-associated domain-containing protein [Thauera aromatica]MCK2096025.1 heavy-metal-associated domain-containing protein [Thauera aromatica]